MSSVKREYSLPAPGIADALYVSGNGTDNDAIFYIDVRKSSVFRVDLSSFIVNTNIDVRFDTFAGAPGAVAGKEITLLITQNSNNEIDYINLRLTENFGPYYDNSSRIGYIDLDDDRLAAVKLISDGINFYPLVALIEGSN